MPAKDLVFTVLGIDRASGTFDKVGKSMDRMSRVGTKSMAALLAASLGAGAGIGTAVTGISVLFSGMAAAALSQNAEVANSFRSLGATIKQDMLADAAPLEDEFVGAAESIAAAYEELRPQMREAFRAAQPHVESLVEGVTEFAGQAMPGMVTAVESAGPVFDGLEHMLAATGRGVGDFFTVISEGAPEAGFALASLGDLMEGVLPNAGQMLVNLSQVWADNGTQAVRVIEDLISVITELSGGALPVVSDAFGVALDVLEGVLGVIEPMTDQLGPLIGMWLSLSLALRTIGAVRSVLTPVGGAIDKMSTSMSTAVGPANKMKTAVGGAVGLLGGGWGIAVLGATAILAAFGRESEQTAQDQRSLTDALLASSGAFDASARQTLRSSQEYQDLAGHIEQAGLSERAYLDTVIEGGPALDRMLSRLKDLGEGTRVTAAAGTEARAAQEAQAEAAAQLHFRTEDLRATIVASIEDFEREQEAIGGVAASMAGAVPGADSLAEAMATLSDQTADTTARADALNTAWRRLLGIEITLEEATANFEGGLDTISGHLEQVKKGTDNWMGALFGAKGQVNLTTEQGRQLSDMLITQGDDWRALAQTTFDTTLQMTGSQEQATAATVAALIKRRNQFVAEATQMFGNAKIAEMLADRYFKLPDDVMTLIQADASNAQAIIDEFHRRNSNRVLWWTLKVRTSEVGRQGLGGRFTEFARGGWTSGREPIRVGEEGEEIFWPDGPGTIIPAPQTRRFLASLRAGASVRARSGAGGFEFEAAPPAARSASPSSHGSDDERIVRLLVRALERVTVTMDGRPVGLLQGRHASLLGRTG